MGISRSKYVAITSSLRLGFGLALAPTPDEGGGVFALFVDGEPLLIDGEALWVTYDA